MMNDRVPMRWPKEWSDPSRLNLLKGTPINCLVGEEPPPFPLGELKFIPLREDQPPEGVVLRKGVWPQVQAAKSTSADAESGPTGAPWVDSNAWLIRLTQVLNPGKAVWLTYDPPPANEVIPPDRLAVPVAEAETYGARWVISLHDSLRKGLESGADEAVEAWKKMIGLLEFSAQHEEWKSWEPVAALAVISDFAGDSEFIATEFLNLATRRHLAYSIVLKSQAPAAALGQHKAVLYIDTQPPEGELLKNLLAFASRGGLLILPKAPPDSGPATETQQGYRIVSHGQGRIAAPEEDWYDPYILAADVHLLMSHRQDVVRIWNGGIMNSYYVASKDGSQAVVQLVNYGGRRRALEDVTVGFAEPYKSAQVFTPQGEQNVTPVQRRLGSEVALPPFTIYAAVELRG